MDQVSGLFATAGRTIGLLKGNARNPAIARRPQTETAVTPKWITTELHMKTWTHEASRL